MTGPSGVWSQVRSDVDPSDEVGDGAELHAEQAVLDSALHALRARQERLATRERRLFTDESPAGQDLLLRDAAHRDLARQQVDAFAAENGLYVGCLFDTGGSATRVGRVGVSATDSEQPILIDWRAEAARPFFTATHADPQGFSVRRHVRVEGHRVSGIEDDLLEAGEAPAGLQLVGPAALLHALALERTGRMRPVVGTLQSQQDAVVRADDGHPLVIQGGPGTGKTVVALHRVAYLLYTHPQLARAGVLVVGPDDSWVRYVENVMPALGESRVAFLAQDQLFPGVSVTVVEQPETAEIKGRLIWVRLLRRAVETRQARVERAVIVRMLDEVLVLSRAWIEQTRATVSAEGLPHNQARALIKKALVRELARRLARIIGDIEDRFEREMAVDVDMVELDRAAVADMVRLWGPNVDVVAQEDRARAEVAEAELNWQHALPDMHEVEDLTESLWPRLSAERFLPALLADAAALEAAANGELTSVELGHVVRSASKGFARSDLPLLDELAELLDGARDLGRSEQAADGYRADMARSTMMEAVAQRDEGDEEHLVAADFVRPDVLAAWSMDHAESTPMDVAASDRSWMFGHVVVDEAQDLDPMAWRLIARRCPPGSLTICGDLRQKTQGRTVGTWRDLLADTIGQRWSLVELSVNYRSTRSIVAVAAAVAQQASTVEVIDAEAIVDGPPNRWIASPTWDAVECNLPALIDELQSTVKGTLAVVCSPHALGRLRPVVAAVAAPSTRCVLATAGEVKGQEFDTVVVVDPARLGRPDGPDWTAAYIAASRAVHRLLFVYLTHPGDRWRTVSEATGLSAMLDRRDGDG